MICAALYGRLGGSSSRRTGPLSRRQRQFHSTAIERRQASFAKALDRVPPPRADRLRAANDGEIEREMGEDMTHRAKAPRMRFLRFLPIAPGKRRHPAEQTLGRPANKPDMAVVLD